MGLGLGQPAAREPVHHVGAHVAPWKQPGLLKRQRRCTGDRATAGVISRQSGEHAQHGRLPGSAATDQCDDLAAVHADRHIVEHMMVAVPLVHVPQLTCDTDVLCGSQSHVRYPSARRSNTRTIASVPIPSSAYTIRPKMMMSIRRKSRALLIRKPIPLSALICSATISVSQAIANDCRAPTSTWGAALGTMMRWNRCQNEKPST